MEVQTEITELIAYTETYTYRVRQFKGEWSIVRWEGRKPSIPPLMDMLTDNGWVGVVKASNLGIKGSKFPTSSAALDKAIK